MKKIYMTPEMEEIKIDSVNPLLNTSGGIVTDGIDTGGFGGTDTGGTMDPEAPELPGMPEVTPEGLLGFPF